MYTMFTGISAALLKRETECFKEAILDKYTRYSHQQCPF